MIALLFSIVTYWLIDLRPGASAFFVYVLWLFLDLIAAESLVVLIASLFPNFILSLAMVAFANGLWMSVNGFLVPTRTLNVFWKYVFHYIDYQVRYNVMNLPAHCRANNARRHMSSAAC